MHQKGFAPILIVLLIAVVGIGGYLIYTNYSNNWSNQTKSSSAPVVTTQTPPPTPSQAPADETVNWKTYKGLGYSLNYPPEWKMESYTDPGYPDIILKSPDYHQTTDGIQTLDKGAEIRVNRKATTETSIDKKIRDDLAGTISSRRDNTEVAGMKALEYEYSYESTDAIATAFIKQGTFYTIRFQYADANSRQKYLTTYKNLVSTFKSTE